MTNRAPMGYMVVVTFLIYALFSSAAAHGETLVPAGPVSGAWTAEGSPYIIQGAVVVNAGDTLSVEPGVTAAFDAGASLEIGGGFSAIGEPDAPIRFSSGADAPAPGLWGGITFRVSGAVLRFCIVEYATTGIFCDGCRIDLTDSLLQHNAENGMTVYAKAVGCDFDTAKPTISSCEIAYNGGYGVAYRGEGDSWKGCEVNAFGNAAGQLTDCDIHHNGVGVRVYARGGHMNNGGSAYPTIAGNHIHENVSHGIDIGGSDDTDAIIYDNRIIGNGGAGIFCESTPQGPRISYNLIAQNVLQGIDADNATISISYNEMTDNGSHGVQAVLIGRLEGNNIYANAGYALHYLGPEDLAAPDNYWGAGDPAAIQDRIYTEPGTGEVILPSFQATYDNQPPAVLSTYPADDAAGLAPGLLIRVVFDEGLKADAIAQEALTVTDGVNSVDGRVLYTDRTLWFKPVAPLQYDTQYTAVLQSGIEDAHYPRNATTQSLTWTFRTMPDCGDRCPGRPVHEKTVGMRITGLAHDGAFDWAIHKDFNYKEPSTIYKMDRAGVVHQMVLSPGNYPSALAYGDGSLWCDDRDTGKIFRLAPDGAVQASFDAPGPRPSGLAFDGEYVWVADYDRQTIYRMTTSGEVAASFPALGYVHDLAFDGRFLWFRETHRIYLLDPVDGAIVDSITPPEDPTGLAFDGTFLLISYETDDDINRIGKFRIRYADETSPTVGEIHPPDGAEDVGAGTIVTAILEDDVGIDPSTITADAVLLSDGTSPVEGAVSLVDDTVRFIPSGRLANGTHYTASLTTHIRDLAGNPLPKPHSWSFTTRAICEAPCPGDVGNVFNSPRGQPSGMAWDGARLLISEGDRFYRVNPSGTIAGSFPSPADSGGGLSFDGTDIWLAASADRTVYKLTPKGAVEDEFRLPLNFSGAGLALDGEHLMIGAAGVPSAYRFDVSGNILGAISLPAPPTGIASDRETMWIASDHADAIFQIDPSGRVLDFFPSPGPRPFGLTFDGANLWCGDISNGKVYQLPLAFMPGDVSGDNLLDLADAVVALKTLCGLQAADSGEAGDINGDGRIGLAEAIYSLQKIASP